MISDVKLPYLFPGLSKSEFHLAFKNVAAWKEVHASVEELYFKFLLFEHQVIRCEEIIKLGNYESQQQYIYKAQDYINMLREPINIFVNDLEKLPELVRDTRLIVLLGNLPTFCIGLKRCLGSTPERSSFKTIKEVTLRIAELLLHALHIADQVLKEYFRGGDK